MKHEWKHPCVKAPEEMLGVGTVASTVNRSASSQNGKHQSTMFAAG